jgi:hypothetical protein
MIGATVNMLDTYLPALLSVVYANELPKEAISRVEAGFRGHDRGDEWRLNVTRRMLFVDGGGVKKTTTFGPRRNLQTNQASFNPPFEQEVAHFDGSRRRLPKVARNGPKTGIVW